MVTRLTFDGPEAADAELAELHEQSKSISEVPGFQALYGIRTGPKEVVIIRIFDSIEGMGRSLAGLLRPDLAEHFSEPPLRMSGPLAVVRTG